MLKAESDYIHTPQLLSGYMEEHTHKKFHLGMNPSPEDSIYSLVTQQNMIHSAFAKMFRGAAIGLISGITYNTISRGNDTELLNTRVALGKYPMIRASRPFVVMGTMFGLSWFLINDVWLNKPHEVNSIKKYYLAHAIQGGLMVATLYHPSAFIYGMVAGASFASAKEGMEKAHLPAGFKLYMSDFDEQKRRKVLMDDEELALSSRSGLSESKRYHAV